MRKAITTVGLGTLSLVFTAAWAGSWGNYNDSFPLFPCQDGWLGCVVDGEIHNTELVKDSTGFPISSIDRVGWNDLEPTGVFSPFAQLSVYTGELPPTEPPPTNPPPQDVPDVENTPDPDPIDQPVAVNDPIEKPSPTHDPIGEPAHKDPAPVTHDVPLDNLPTQDPKPEVVVTNDPKPAEPVVRDNPVPTTNPATNNKTPEPKPEVKPDNTVKEPVVASLDPKPSPKPISILSNKPKTPVGDDSCDVLTKLEPKAMLGKLTKGQTACLEARVGKESKQTSKDKISRILMANAYASGDKRTWEKLIKRHLDEIDRSDPDLCYKYALHLSRKGPGRAKGVIRWAEVALENRFNWQGNTYKSRVNSLYKLKAQAGQRLWQAASGVYNGNPSPDNKAKMEKARNQTKVFARDWLDYAKESGRDHTKALQLCVSAAGTDDYCGG
jgi:hypothetical protein